MSVVSVGAERRRTVGRRPRRVCASALKENIGMLLNNIAASNTNKRALVGFMVSPVVGLPGFA
jgi:hypothetical protein